VLTTDNDTNIVNQQVTILGNYNSSCVTSSYNHYQFSSSSSIFISNRCHHRHHCCHRHHHLRLNNLIFPTIFHRKITKPSRAKPKFALLSRFANTHFIKEQQINAVNRLYIESSDSQVQLRVWVSLNKQKNVLLHVNKVNSNTDQLSHSTLQKPNTSNWQNTSAPWNVLEVHVNERQIETYVVSVWRSDALNWQGRLGDLPNVMSASRRNWIPNRTVSLLITNAQYTDIINIAKTTN